MLTGGTHLSDPKNKKEKEKVLLWDRTRDLSDGSKEAYGLSPSQVGGGNGQKCVRPGTR